MVTRLSTSDAAFYHQENTSTPLYVGSLSILRKPRGGLSYDALLETVERRLPQIPRYRQKVREVTLGLARPVWVDDPDFDITYHVRRSALPSPGSDAQLHDLVSRLAGRLMDRTRPLWEMYLIEGLIGNRLAIYIKSHQALINGMTALEIGHVIADRNRRPTAGVEDIWLPAGEPSTGQLVFDAVGDWLARPGVPHAPGAACRPPLSRELGSLHGTKELKVYEPYAGGRPARHCPPTSPHTPPRSHTFPPHRSARHPCGRGTPSGAALSALRRIVQ